MRQDFQVFQRLFVSWKFSAVAPIGMLAFAKS